MVLFSVGFSLACPPVSSMLGVLSMVVPFPSDCPSAKRRLAFPCALWDGECCWGVDLHPGTLHLDASSLKGERLLCSLSS